MSELKNMINDQHDEIDLLDLIRTIWDKKLWIIFSISICTFISGIYAFIAEEQWTSKATVIEPQTYDISDYLSIYGEYNRILGLESLSDEDVSKSLFNSFKRLAQSVDIRNEFFSQSEIFKEKINDKDEKAQRLALSKLTNESMKFINPDLKKDPNAIGNTLSFYTSNPIEAQETLTKVIDFINDRASKSESGNFIAKIKNTLSELKSEKSRMQEMFSVDKNIQLENLTKAYDIAIKAGIKEYSQKLTTSNSSYVIAALSDSKIPLPESKLVDDNYLFMLGEKYLKAQIDVVNEKGIVYPQRYYTIELQIKSLDALLEKMSKVKVKTYSYQSTASYPVEKDKPKRLIILILGFVFGLVLSISVLFVRALFDKN